MISDYRKATIRYSLLIFFVVSLLFLYPCAVFGPFRGLLIGLMTWSLWVLSIPARHGRYVFGWYARLKRNEVKHTEPKMLLGALLINVIILMLFRPLYHSTYFTRHLFRILSKPNPYWLMILISALGTLYPYLVGEEQFKLHKTYHRSIRIVLVFIGIALFFYFSWYDLVILLNDWV